MKAVKVYKYINGQFKMKKKKPPLYPTSNQQFSISINCLVLTV